MPAKLEHLALRLLMSCVSQILTGEKHENYVCQAFAKVWQAQPVESYSERLTDIVFMFFASQSLTGEKHEKYECQVCAKS